jgi:hypothetical protein
VYEIFYDDGSNENAFFVNNNNYLAVKFTPSGYPSALYSSKFYVVNDLGGEVFLYCWDDNGEDGKPGDIIFGPFPFYMDQGWNEFRFANEGIDLPLSDGSIYVGYQQLDVDFSIGVDIESPSNARNSMINIGAGWEELSAYAANGVWMVRAQMDGQNELNNDIENNDILPNEFVLNQNFPNPFNPSTTINFGLLEKSKTTLDVYNILGENVLNVVNENLEPGFYNVKINMDDLASGMYFYRLTAFSRDGQQLYTDMKKMILLQ